MFDQTITPRDSEEILAAGVWAYALLNECSFLKASVCSHASMPNLKLRILFFPVHFWQPESQVIQRYRNGDVTQVNG